MQRKRVNSSLPSICALLRSEQEVGIYTGDHPAKTRSIDIVLRHHPHDLQEVVLDVWSMPGNKYFPSSLANCSGIRALRIRSHDNVHGLFVIFTSALQHSTNNLQKLELFSTPLSPSLSAA
eukprot:scpid112722/ scgid30870/ 